MIPDAPKPDMTGASSIPTISVSPPSLRPDEDPFAPHVPLVFRYEREAKRQPSQTSLSVFSRGRASMYSPSFLYSPPSDFIPESSPRPSSYIPSSMSIAEVQAAEHRPGLPSSAENQQAASLIPLFPECPSSSSKDWTLTLESVSRPYLRRNCRPSTAPAKTSEHARNAFRSAQSSRLPPVNTAPPPYSERQSDSSSPDSVESFAFNDHPYSSPYSISSAARDTPSRKTQSHQPSRNEPLQPSTPSRKKRARFSEQLPKNNLKPAPKALQPEREPRSRWWLDTDDPDEDDMAYYSASSSLTSFLSLT